MSAAGERRVTDLLILCCGFLAGTVLRVMRWDQWPPGPWADEAYAVRVARLFARDAGASIFSSSPLVPPDAGFVNAWTSHVYLAYVALVDRLAGGGLLSMRVLSIGPAVLLLFASLLLAHAVSRGRSAALAGSTVLLATSFWLLTTGRWGWDAVATTALLVLAAWAGIVAREKGVGWALLSGVLLGAAQYGYVASRLALAVPAVLLAHAVWRRDRAALRRVALLGIGLAAVTGPLAVHELTHPERALARASEVGILAGGNAGADLLANVRDMAEMFLLRGDPNGRHGDPEKPVLPPLVTGLALVGAAAGLRSRDAAAGMSAASFGAAAGELTLWAGALLLGGLVARTPGGNAFRISPAAPFLLILAGLGVAAVLALLPNRAKRGGALLLGGALLAIAVLDVRGFVRWATSPLTFGMFGGPERELADAIRQELLRGRAEVILHPVAAARNPIVVEMLLSRPGETRPAVRIADLLGPLPYRFLPDSDVLYAGGAPPAFAVEVGRAPRRENLPEWRLYRIPARAARAEAGRRLEGTWFPPAATGSFLAEESGLYTFRAPGPRPGTTGPLLLTFDGERRGPFPGGVGLLLEAGRHDIRVEASGPVHVVLPSGFETRPISSSPPRRETPPAR